MLIPIASWWVPPRWRRPLAAVAIVLGVALAGLLGYQELVKQGFVRYNKWDRRVRGTLRVGQQAPDLELTSYAGSPLRLSTLWAKKPAVLVFGSCT